MSYKKGDLVLSKKGNVCMILHVEPYGRYASGFCDVVWLSTGFIRTGLHRQYLGKVLSGSR